MTFLINGLLSTFHKSSSNDLDIQSFLSLLLKAMLKDYERSLNHFIYGDLPLET